MNDGEADDAMAEASVLFQQREKKNQTEEGGLKREGRTYNEFSLQGEEEELKHKLDLLHRNAVCFSDCWDAYEWTDMIFFQENQSASNALDMKTASSASKQLSVRMYTAPDTMKGLCAVRSKEEGTLVKKAASRRKCNMVRVTEIVASSGILDVLQCLGFRQITQVFVKARVYLSKVGTPNSTTLLVQRHFSDPEHNTPLFLRKGGRAEPVTAWLIEAKARCEGDGAVAATTDLHLFNYAANFGPLLNLRKVEDSALSEAERELVHSSHPRRL
ncbi:fkbp-type peptidyl-prolyl cis-trans isomerase,related [Neospora caninum Liverpool]|uniref:FKBP-type Peptidyl-prolyl cis-trans isomerase,related n=1 Tax=Neospora caninum (strain Liverpool) TaxID=572307 RepID=F0V805_NEOCL|nr:fkbp-type peptidyl-prolyl cis-trans isomerase,related [Neospora caninum Liverpool]CBZ49846.1 fkbp-type peptidyl-prolyl cis-trans isomerase,related [Neospora caninum Liverpool]CEL64435.1 TPA: FKBP-type peptidyl-prolyl cis-trans isomerase,related [Neospora caninum Liverpool]|eukprot:XP_003879881.1 fkbp-type peptidyl-prolyl cis-trans isomerase,related [Neospora caninum Liverpool]